MFVHYILFLLSALVSTQAQFVASPSLWLDASKIGYANLDSNDNLVSWSDASTNAQTYTPSTRAQFDVSGGLNGRPVIRFDGVASSGSVTGYSVSNELSAFLVVRPTPLSAYQCIFDGPSSSPPMLWIDGSNRYEFNSPTGVVSTYTVNGSLPNVVSLLYSQSQSVFSMYIDGVLAGTSTSWTTLSSTFSLSLFNRAGGQNYNGDVSEVVFYSRLLSDTERTNMESYLTNKWITSATPDSTSTLTCGTPSATSCSVVCTLTFKSTSSNVWQFSSRHSLSDGGLGGSFSTLFSTSAVSSYSDSFTVVYNFPTSASTTAAITLRVSSLPAGVSAVVMNPCFTPSSSTLLGSMPFYYPLQGSLVDGTGQSNTATATNFPNITSGPLNSPYGAYSFLTSSAQVITAPTANNLPIGNAARSLCLWMRSTGLVNDATPSVSAGWGTSSLTGFWGVGLGTASRLRVIDGVSSTLIAYPATNNQWFHFCLTYDQTTTTGYINGVLARAWSVSSINTLSGPLVIGCRWDGQECHTGAVSDVRVFNTSLSQTQIQAIYGQSVNVPSTSLLAWYPLQGSLADGFGFGRDASNANTALLIPGTDKNGRSSGSVKFVGTDISRYYTPALPNLYQGNVPRTLAVWMRLNNVPSAGTRTCMTGFGMMATRTYFGLCVIGVAGSVLPQIFVNDINTDVNATTAIADGQWHHVAGNWDGTFLSIYVDGVLSNQINRAATPLLAGGSSTLFMGGLPDATSLFSGWLADVRVYNYSLSITDIQTLALFDVPDTTTAINCPPRVSVLQTVTCTIIPMKNGVVITADWFAFRLSVGQQGNISSITPSSRATSFTFTFTAPRNPGFVTLTSAVTLPILLEIYHPAGESLSFTPGRTFNLHLIARSSLNNPNVYTSRPIYVTSSTSGQFQVSDTAGSSFTAVSQSAFSPLVWQTSMTTVNPSPNSAVTANAVSPSWILNILSFTAPDSTSSISCSSFIVSTQSSLNCTITARKSGQPIQTQFSMFSPTISTLNLVSASPFCTIVSPPVSSRYGFNFTVTIATGTQPGNFLLADGVSSNTVVFGVTGSLPTSISSSCVTTN